SPDRRGGGRDPGGARAYLARWLAARDPGVTHRRARGAGAVPVRGAEGRPSLPRTRVPDGGPFRAGGLPVGGLSGIRRARDAVVAPGRRALAPRHAGLDARGPPARCAAPGCRRRYALRPLLRRRPSRLSRFHPAPAAWHRLLGRRVARVLSAGGDV